jgi:hypothetical protein
MDLFPSRATREQERMLVEVKSEILNSGYFLPAIEVAKAFYDNHDSIEYVSGSGVTGAEHSMKIAVVRAILR